MNKSPEIIILAAALGLLAVGAGTMAFLFPSLEDITGVKKNNIVVETGQKTAELDEEYLYSIS